MMTVFPAPTINKNNLPTTFPIINFLACFITYKAKNNQRILILTKQKIRVAIYFMQSKIVAF